MTTVYILEEIAVHDLHGQLQVAQLILVAVALPLGSEGIGAFLVVVVVGALPILEQTVDSLLAVIVADTEGLALAVVQFNGNILGQIQIFFLNAQQNSQGSGVIISTRYPSSAYSHSIPLFRRRSARA